MYTAKFIPGSIVTVKGRGQQQHKVLSNSQNYAFTVKLGRNREPLPSDTAEFIDHAELTRVNP